MESSRRTQEQDVNFPALAVALQHPAVAADQHNICTLLQVNKTWRTAVQQSAASLTDIKFYNHIASDSSNEASSFARWLAKHSGVICNLSIHPRYGPEESVAVAREVVQHVIELGLQAAAAAVSAVSISSVDKIRPQLRLRSFSSSVPPTAAMLAALPAATLTKLELDQLANSDWYLGLGQLTSLRQLVMDMREVGPQHSAALGCFVAISSLKMLTSLDLSGVPCECDTKMFPVQLQMLDLQYRDGISGDDSPLDADGVVVDLQHLTRLRQLQLSAYELAAGSSVPCNLSYLKLSVDGWAAGAVSGLSSLNQLNSLELDVLCMNSQHLEPFKQLTQLQRLTMLLGEDANPLEVADTWADLPLCDLQLEQTYPDATLYSSVVQLMQRAGEATALTRLEVCLFHVVPDHPGAEKLTVCERLRTLTNLKELTLRIGTPDDFEEHDAQHLAALGTLTSLDLCLCGSGPYMDATTLCLLALKLTDLKVLRVRDSNCVLEVGDTAALPAIGRLTTLKVLCLEYLPMKAARRGLQLLTDLIRLTELDGFQTAGEEALQAFWNSIKSSRKRMHRPVYHDSLVIR